MQAAEAQQQVIFLEQELEAKGREAADLLSDTLALKVRVRRMPGEAAPRDAEALTCGAWSCRGERTTCKTPSTGRWTGPAPSRRH